MKKKLLTLSMTMLMLAALLVPASAETGTDYVNSSLIPVKVFKFYDTNANGIWDYLVDPWISGWQIQTLDLQGNVLETRYTNEYGYAAFTPGFSSVREVMPSGGNWIMTTTDDYAVGGHRKFGNICLGAGGGLTPGFWGNKNGEKMVGADDLAMLAALNLVNAGGSAFDPGSFPALSSWLRDGKATNMAYMLSVQLAAMELNVYNKKVSGNAMIYAPGTVSAGSLGFATVNAVMAEADSELGAHGFTPSGSSFRAYQETLKNALDNANNNNTFVQAYPCSFHY